MAELTKEAREFTDLVKATGWSQSEVARKLFITPPHVSQILGGTAQPSRALIQLLKLTIMGDRPDVLQPSGAPKEAAQLREAYTPWADQVLRQLKALNEEDRERVLIGLNSFLQCIPKRGKKTERKEAA